jgi:hypothetical protein
VEGRGERGARTDAYPESRGVGGERGEGAAREGGRREPPAGARLGDARSASTRSSSVGVEGPASSEPCSQSQLANSCQGWRERGGAEDVGVGRGPPARASRRPRVDTRVDTHKRADTRVQTHIRTTPPGHTATHARDRTKIATGRGGQAPAASAPAAPPRRAPAPPPWWPHPQPPARLCEQPLGALGLQEKQLKQVPHGGLVRRGGRLLGVVAAASDSKGGRGAGLGCGRWPPARAQSGARGRGRGGRRGREAIRSGGLPTPRPRRLPASAAVPAPLLAQARGAGQSPQVAPPPGPPHLPPDMRICRMPRA